MLKQLHVEHFALIDECDLHFHQGFTAFTGETGAGKSLLIDAISLLCGERASASFVQRGQEKAVISGIFTLSDGTEVALLREITKEGKSSVRINGKTASLQTLKEVTHNLIDIHSQHDTQYLLNKNSHLSLLDNTLSNCDLIEETHLAYKKYATLKKEYEEFLHTSLTESDAEYLRFEVEEIEKAKLHVGEDEDLEDRLKEIQNFEKIYGRLNDAIDLFEKEEGADELLYEISSNLSSLNDHHPLNELSNLFKEKYYDLKDVVDQIKDIKDAQSFDEDEINEIQSRLFEIGRLKRKYGRSIALVLEHQQRSEDLLNAMTHRAETLERMEYEMNHAYENFVQVAQQLSTLRKSSAKQLENQVIAQLRDLMLPYANFSVDFNEFEGNSTGIDDVEFLISMNPQESLRPLKMVASGGELSRLMLGLKTIFTALQGISCVIFDEIDTGVSGAVATSIGLKMSLLSKTAQVFSVTHLAQVAACAKHHVFVSKKVVDEQTKITIRELTRQQRIEQLAMISSGTTSELSMNAAEELFISNQSLAKN